MKTIIAGSRSITNPRVVFQAVEESGFEISEVVSGCARGVDALGEHYAKTFGIPIKRIPADWKRDGRAAGPMRNRAMCGYADALIAVWDGESRGTKHCIDTAIQCGLEVYVRNVYERTRDPR